MPRYHFGEFVLSPRRRVLLRDGREQPLIPRYFDLLVFLVERRHEAVHRRDIFDGVWNDVIVSDSALSQAVRVLRRVLGDDPREPRFIRTVSRHGYQFVCPDVREEPDDESVRPAVDPAALVARPASVDPPAPVAPADVTDPYEPLLERLTRPATGEDERREAAELLHALGTDEALRRLGERPGHAEARALLRDARWDVAEAGSVPILGHPAASAAAWHLVRLRLRRASRAAAIRWAGAAAGGGLAGLAAGAAGGLLLTAAPDGTAAMEVIPALAAVGAGAGAAGGAGVGAGLAVAETVARSARTVALPIGGAAGGGLVGLLVQWLGRWTLATLLGLHLDLGGGLEGIVIGGAAGLAYAASTRHPDGGLAAPRGRRRLLASAVSAAACGAAALGLALAGRPLVGGTVHLMAEASRGSQATLAPLGRLLGETDFGPLTRSLIATGEGAVFGLGLAFGLTRRPRPRRDA